MKKTALALIAALSVSGCALREAEMSDAFLKCPECRSDWTAIPEDNGYGSLHYYELRKQIWERANNPHGMSPEQAEQAVRALDGSREYFWYWYGHK